MANDKYVGKVVFVYLPNNARPRYRWIVKKREDGRYVARAPKIGVLIRDLDKKLEKDYNSEQLLPKNFSFREKKKEAKKTEKTKDKPKNKTKDKPKDKPKNKTKDNCKDKAKNKTKDKPKDKAKNKTKKK